MARKKKNLSRKSFTRKVQNTPKMKSIRKKLRDAKLKHKRLGAEYRRALSKESKRLSKKYY